MEVKLVSKCEVLALRREVPEVVSESLVVVRVPLEEEEEDGITPSVNTE